MPAKYANVDRAIRLEADIQQVPFAQILWIFHNSIAKHQ